MEVLQDSEEPRSTVTVRNWSSLEISAASAAEAFRVDELSLEV
jgi:hypothetical protein